MMDYKDSRDSKDSKDYKDTNEFKIDTNAGDNKISNANAGDNNYEEACSEFLAISDLISEGYVKSPKVKNYIRSPRNDGKLSEEPIELFSPSGDYNSYDFVDAKIGDAKTIDAKIGDENKSSKFDSPYYFPFTRIPIKIPSYDPKFSGYNNTSQVKIKIHRSCKFFHEGKEIDIDTYSKLNATGKYQNDMELKLDDGKDEKNRSDNDKGECDNDKGECDDDKGAYGIGIAAYRMELILKADEKNISYST